jgi:hypothetical protein
MDLVSARLFAIRGFLALAAENLNPTTEAEAFKYFFKALSQLLDLPSFQKYAEEEFAKQALENCRRKNEKSFVTKQ